MTAATSSTPSKLRTELGWAPSVEWEQGLADTVAWYEANRDWWEPLLARAPVAEGSWGTGVPVAFFPGTTGILFRQFALTIAFSIAISAFNALTLAPVLAAIFLSGGHRKKWWWLQKFDDGVAAMTRGYRRVLHHVLDFKLVMAMVFFSGLGLTYFVFTRVPTGSCRMRTRDISSS